MGKVNLQTPKAAQIMNIVSFFDQHKLHDNSNLRELQTDIYFHLWPRDVLHLQHDKLFTACVKKKKKKEWEKEREGKREQESFD